MLDAFGSDWLLNLVFQSGSETKGAEVSLTALWPGVDDRPVRVLAGAEVAVGVADQITLTGWPHGLRAGTCHGGSHMPCGGPTSRKDVPFGA